MTMNTNQKILIIDDHYFIVRGLQETVKPLHIDATGVGTAKHALQVLREKQFQLIVLDIDLPDIDGKTLLQLIRMKDQETPILISSASKDIAMIQWLIQNGAQGYTHKSQAPEVTSHAIQTLIKGETYVPPDLMSVMTSKNETQHHLARQIKITPKQREILFLLAQGMSNQALAQELNIAQTTVGTHLKKIFNTLNVNNRTQCVKVAQNLGII